MVSPPPPPTIADGCVEQSGNVRAAVTKQAASRRLASRARSLEIAGDDSFRPLCTSAEHGVAGD